MGHPWRVCCCKCSSNEPRTSSSNNSNSNSRRLAMLLQGRGHMRAWTFFHQHLPQQQASGGVNLLLLLLETLWGL